MNTLLTILLVGLALYGLVRFVKMRNEAPKEGSYEPGKKNTSKKDILK